MRLPFILCALLAAEQPALAAPDPWEWQCRGTLGCHTPDEWLAIDLRAKLRELQELEKEACQRGLRVYLVDPDMRDSVSLPRALIVVSKELKL